jgi:hypothetical protein
MGLSKLLLESATPLLAGITFTGNGHDFGTLKPSKFRAYAVSDQASAANGFKIEGSNDSFIWYSAGPPAQAMAALVANTPVILEVPVVFRYYRVKLTNGGVNQTQLVINSAAIDQ